MTARSSTDAVSCSKSWVVARLRETMQDTVVKMARSYSSNASPVTLLLAFMTPTVLPFTFNGTHISELVR